jgi:CRP-like cAMP-binding protein
MSSRLAPDHCRIACQSRLISAMPEELRDTLLASAHLAHLRRGETIFHHGDTAHAIHIVADGWVKLYRIAPNGTEAVVGVMTRGQSFGEPIALRRGSYPVTAEATTACQVIAIPAQAFLDILHAHPEIATAILSATFLHLQGLIEQIEQLKALSGAQRVAEFLLELCPEGVESATVVLPYDKILIAGRLGMKPESLSRAFARLRDHGVRITHSSAAIASVRNLRDIAHADAVGALSRAI